MTQLEDSPSPRRGAASLPPKAAAAGAALIWGWAVALVLTRHHIVDTYHVVASAPPVWGFLALPAVQLLFVAAAVACWTATLLATSTRPATDRRAALAWLAVAALVPLADLCRAAAIDLPHTFLEPLFLAALTGMAAERVARGIGAAGHDLGRAARWRGWLPLTCLLAAAAAGWWYAESLAAQGEFMLGYHDFGHFARRVVNTWEGRGFLKEAPDLPAFWDHFNPGLALLVPLWGLCQDARLFFALQAACLAAPAPLVYAAARRLGYLPAVSSLWSIAYLAYPPVGLLNLNYSYGWHPVSLALPALFAAAAALLSRRYAAALALLLLACSFKEDVLVTAACLAAAMALERAWTGLTRCGDADAAPASELSTRLPAVAWAAVWAGLTAGLAIVLVTAPFAEFQAQRFSNLGANPVEILLSPVLRPSVFWGELGSPRTAWFVLGLLVPWHLPALWRGRWILLALAPPVLVLSTWSYPAGRSLAFQYVTTLIPIATLAAMVGAARGGPRRGEAREAERGMSSAGSMAASSRAVAATAAALCASLFFGDLPWSGETLTMIRVQTYPVGEDQQLDNPRGEGTRGNQLLLELTRSLNRPDVAVLATGRVAAHLLNVRRLETVEQATIRWSALEQEAGEGRSGIEVFDWVVLDTREHFMQSPEKTERMFRCAREAGYRVEVLAEGVVAMRRAAAEEER